MQKKVWGQLAPGPVTVKDANFLGLGKKHIDPKGNSRMKFPLLLSLSLWRADVQRNEM